jgi:hypothetical protein
MIIRSLLLIISSYLHHKYHIGNIFEGKLPVAIL